MANMQHLPNRLPSGTTLLIRSIPVRVVRSGKDAYNEPTYRLAWPRYEANGWIMPAMTTSTKYSRDDLSGYGVVMV